MDRKFWEPIQAIALPFKLTCLPFLLCQDFNCDSCCVVIVSSSVDQRSLLKTTCLVIEAILRALRCTQSQYVLDCLLMKVNMSWYWYHHIHGDGYYLLYVKNRAMILWSSIWDFYWSKISSFLPNLYKSFNLDMLLLLTSECQLIRVHIFRLKNLSITVLWMIVTSVTT